MTAPAYTESVTVTARRPAEVVEVVELLYRGVYSSGLLAAVSVTLLAAAIAPAQLGEGIASRIAVSVGWALVLAVLLRERRRTYSALRRRPWLLIIVGAALGFVAVLTGRRLDHLIYVVALTLGVLGVATPLRWVIGATTATLVGFAIVQLPAGTASPELAVPLLVIPATFWWLVEVLARFIAQTQSVAEPPELSGASARPSRASGGAPPTTPRQRSLELAATQGVETVSSDDHISGRPLTARQLEVVLLCAEGLNHLQVAECLGLHPQQVRRHLRAARGRAGVQTTAQLVVWAVNAGLIPNPGSPKPS